MFNKELIIKNPDDNLRLVFKHSDNDSLLSDSTNNPQPAKKSDRYIVLSHKLKIILFLKG